jgi:hypothetical protein
VFSFGAAIVFSCKLSSFPFVPNLTLLLPCKDRPTSPSSCVQNYNKMWQNKCHLLKTHTSICCIVVILGTIRMMKKKTSSRTQYESNQHFPFQNTFAPTPDIGKVKGTVSGGSSMFS